MKLRNYKPSDCEALIQLFYRTVHKINAKDYTSEQLSVWATGHEDPKQWNESFLEHTTMVAEQDNSIVGFGDMTSDGYLDRLFVHDEHQGEGIGSAIGRALEESVQAAGFTTHASVTAKPFFEKMGYRTVKEQTVIRNNTALIYFIMEK
jgi:putative acetyltransferase